MFAAPFIVASLLVIALGLMALLIRGDSLVRVGLLGVVASVLPWSAGSAYSMTLQDPDQVERVARIYMSSVSLIGPAMMFLVLAIVRRVSRHRLLLAFATACALATSVLSWTTHLVVDGVWLIPWGTYYPLSGGPVGILHVVQFVVWAGLGGAIASRAQARERSARRRVNTRLIVVGLVLATTGAADLLLFSGYGVFPFSSVSAIGAMGMFIFALATQDLMHMRGFDRAGLYELVAVAFVGCSVFVIAIAVDGSPVASSPLVAAFVFAPVLLLAHVTVTELRRGLANQTRRDTNDQRDRRVDAYIDSVTNAQDRAALAEQLASLIEGFFGLANMRLLVLDQEQWRPLSGAAPEHTVRLDARARAWLVANRLPLVDEDLPSRRLGGLRRPIESLLRSLDAEVLIPLVDRANLVGAIISDQPGDGRALREEDAAALMQIADATAGALTYVDLLDAAEQQVEVAREVEVAAAVQRARTPGQHRTRYSACEIVQHYAPASSFSGSFWTHCELTDGRILVAMGEVAGDGVPTALISGAVLGAAETAAVMLGSGLDVISFMGLLNASLLEVGGDTHAMSVFAAVFDLDEMRVTFANAAHPAPYRCRGPVDERGRAQLRALMSRGTPLGVREPPLAAATLAILPGDVVLLHSAPLVGSRSPEGVEFGDRRVQHFLRRHVPSAGPALCEILVDHALTHYGPSGPEGDVAVIAVHIDAQDEAGHDTP